MRCVKSNLSGRDVGLERIRRVVGPSLVRSLHFTIVIGTYAWKHKDQK